MQNALIMGIVNLTPDSFSDGGVFFDTKSALKQCMKLIEDGADIIDLGAESTRPGAKFVTVEEEWARLKNVLHQLSKVPTKTAISIDTNKPEIMYRALDFGISYINNVRGLCDSETLSKLSKNRTLNYICMHMEGTPETMQVQPLTKDNAAKQVESFFDLSVENLMACGFESDRIYMDPGIGFGKDLGANLSLLAATKDLSEKFALCIGLSRKSFIGKLLDIESASARDESSKLLELGQIFAGANIIRTHSVKPLIQWRSLLN